MATATASTTDYSDDTIVRRNIKRELYCKLTDEEQLRIAKTRSVKEAELEELEGDLDREKKKRKEQIDELGDEVKKMGRELRTGEQERTVACDEVFRMIDGTGFIVVVRKDTYAEVERRPANAHESQRYLPGVDGPGATGLLDQANAARSAQPANDDASDVPGDETDDGEGNDSDDAEEGGEIEATEKPAAKRTKKPKSGKAK
jgi:hypothetical protein